MRYRIRPVKSEHSSQLTACVPGSVFGDNTERLWPFRYAFGKYVWYIPVCCSCGSIPGYTVVKRVTNLRDTASATIVCSSAESGVCSHQFIDGRIVDCRYRRSNGVKPYRNDFRRYLSRSIIHRYFVLIRTIITTIEENLILYVFLYVYAGKLLKPPTAILVINFFKKGQRYRYLCTVVKSLFYDHGVGCPQSIRVKPLTGKFKARRQG